MAATIEDVLSGRERWCIITGDCMEVMSEMPDGSIDTIFTSPPYNLGNTSGGGFPAATFGHYDQTAGMNKRGGQGKWQAASRMEGLAHGYAAHEDAMTHENYVVWQKKCLLEMWRLTTENGCIFYNHKSRIFSGKLVTPFEYNPDLPVRQIIIWARAGGINFSSAFYVPTHEWIMLFARTGFRLRDKGASGAGDVWYVPQESNPDHPAPFPIRLPLMALETLNPGVVLDPYAGIASTGVACLQSGHRFIGIELSEKYASIGRHRLEQTERDQRDSLFPVTFDGPVAGLFDAIDEPLNS